MPASIGNISSSKESTSALAPITTYSPMSTPPMSNSPKTPSNMLSLATWPSLATHQYPSSIKTSFPSLNSNIISHTTSAASTNSTMTSGSVQVSPIMSPGPLLPSTNNTSTQGSPDILYSRDCEGMGIQAPFDELTDSIVSRKLSYSAMAETSVLSKSPGIIRRLSNRASQLASSRRRPSSNAMKRDHSSGPVIMRRRSDSTSTVSGAYKSGALFSDSDDELIVDIKEESNESREVSSRENLIRTESVGLSNANLTAAGPVISSALLQGTQMLKVSRKKKKFKRLTLILENQAAKVTWDKNRPSKSFYIDDIKDIRAGANARTYRQEFGVPAEDESKFFSIVYAVPDKSKGRGQKIMHLIASDEHTFELWTTTLDAISKHRQELMASLSSFHEKAVRQYWRIEMNRKFQDKPHSSDDEEIDFVGVESLCRSLHINGSSSSLKSRFNQADASGSGRLNFAEFQEFVKLMKRREDVRTLIYRKIASERGITMEGFLKFLKDVQGEDVETDRAHWENVFVKFVRRSKSKEQAQQDAAEGGTLYMSDSALSNFLISTFNVPMHAQPAKYTLDRPLNEYFISSSHNTYLLGRQVAGQSSIEAYISVLNRGCRCVEIDCWNGSEGPVVMHGRTLTSQVSFADVMSTVSKYAFVKSPFPLCISLEVHCNPQQQQMMADIIKETCGEKLVTSPLDPNLEQLPSPSQLLHRIIIKVKKPRTFDDVPLIENRRIGRNRGNSLNSPHVQPTQLDNSTISAGLLPPSNFQRINLITNQGQLRYPSNDAHDSLSSTSDSEGLTEDIARARESSRTNKTSNIIKALGELGVYTRGIPNLGFDHPETKTYNHIFSFMENTFDRSNKTQEDKHAIIQHNIHYMMRVYPNGWRVASTNFDPLKYWRRGVQMVALNWQTFDLGMQINEAMFASGTDCSGYVLKPSELREVSSNPCVTEASSDGRIKRERKNVAFSINVISAQQLMRPKTLAPSRSVDPYVEVEVYHADDKSKENKGVVGAGGLDASSKDGFSSLGVPHRRRTQIITENGFNPMFNKKFHFSLTTKYPELIFIRWTVRYSPDGNNYNEKSPPLAIFTAKLNSLKQGYRTLPLFDSNGDQFLFSSLFCYIKIEPVTSFYVNDPEADPTESVGMLKIIGRSPFNRPTL
ncbi:1-phosphatidylinositol 4,5-bisphosphate phosphodiesterase 1 [Podosphaera aphanis]|nr:1-phosphatidylinositol 4,5-bisphosphate phosphodiesterase 1 [Podosphaera aphanis]